jgi:3-deoxy-D-manno-octulosonic-acid transferase
VSRLPAPLRAYRLFSAAMRPFTPLFLARRLRHGKEHAERLHERRGVSALARPPGPLVWLHAASIGELISVLPLIERIHGREVNVLVTSGTVTSGGLAEQRLPRGVIHQFVPIDVPKYVRRFLEHWQPDLALFVESELWPNIMIETSQRGVPMILINGRLSANSFRRWRYAPRSIGALLNRLDLCLARTPADAERLGELGARHVVTTGDLKLDGPAPPADRTKLAALQNAIGGRPLVAAASTHAGEEAVMVEAHQRLAGNFPGLLTLIVPRHPERGAGVADIARAAGLRARLRSRGELPDAATDVYIADTVGELGLVYRLAPIVFIGGSLIRHGGQNPIEPAKLGAAILHGPHVWNFAEIYAALDQARGAETVADADKLTAGLAGMLAQPERRGRIADAARTTVDGLSGALERTLQSLDPYLMQLRLERADHA